jgi:uncharacterized protein
VTAPSPAESGIAPVASAERLALLDVVRGFTLYGVLLANTVPWFSGLGFLPKVEAAARLGRADEVALFLVTVFVSRKSQTLLTCLFGLGFAIQLARAGSRGGGIGRLYVRRLLILLMIGIGHAALVWWGDVLWGYALTGGVLLLFRARSDRALLLWAFALIFVPKLVTSVPAASHLLERVIPAPADRDAFNREVLSACRGDDYAHLVRMQAQRTFYQFCHHAPEYIPWMMGHFLIGYWVGRRRLLEKAAEHLATWQRLLVWGAGLGVAGGVVSAMKGIFVRRGVELSTGWKLALIVPEEGGILAMALAYVSALVLLMQKPWWRSKLMRLAPAGRMALSTYLSQSAIMTFLFYGWGLGLMLRVGPAWCIPITLAVFAGQLVVANAWLSRWQFGPVEWIWRWLTYGRFPSMRPASRNLAPSGQ